MKKVQEKPCPVCGKTTYRKKTVWYRDKKKYRSNMLPLICMTCGYGKKEKSFEKKSTSISLR